MTDPLRKRGAAVPRPAGLFLLAVVQVLVVLPVWSGQAVVDDPGFGVDLWGFLFDWLFSIYPVSVGAVLIGAGHLADRYGPRRILLLGLGGYAVGAVLAGATTSGWALVGGLLVQGVGAGLMQVCVLCLVARRPKEQFAPALGAIAGMLVAADVGGIVLADQVAAALGWPWVFWAVVPVAAAAWAVALRLPAEDGNPALAIETALVWSASFVAACALVFAVEFPIRGLEIGASMPLLLGGGVAVSLILLSSLRVPGLRLLVAPAVRRGVLLLFVGGAAVECAVVVVLGRQADSPTMGLYAIVAAVTGILAVPAGLGRVGPRGVAAAGFVALALALLALTLPAGLTLVAGVLLAVGAPAVLAGALAGPLQEAPDGRAGLAAGYVVAAGYVGQTAALAALFAAFSGLGADAVYARVALAGAVLAVVGLVASVVIRTRSRQA